MNLEISIDNYPNKSYTTTVGGQRVEITLRWLSRGGTSGFWTFSFVVLETGASSNGRRIKSGMSILHPRVGGFRGNFAAVPITAPEQTLGVEPWDNTHKLVYLGE